MLTLANAIDWIDPVEIGLPPSFLDLIKCRVPMVLSKVPSVIDPIGLVALVTSIVIVLIA